MSDITYAKTESMLTFGELMFSNKKSLLSLLFKPNSQV